MCTAFYKKRREKMELQIITNETLAIAPWLAAMIPAAVGGLANAVSGIFGNKSRRKENDKAFERQKELMEMQQQQQYDMWGKTNYGAQKTEMENAGLNPALMYGMGGGGGTTTGSGGNATVSQPNIENVGMDIAGIAQLRLLKAQEENIKADTKAKEAQAIETETRANKTAGVDTAQAEENLRNTKFINDVNDAIGVGTKANKESAEAEIQQLLSERMNADWATFKAVGYGKEPFDSANSLAAKMIEAGYLETVQRIKSLEAGIGKTNAEKAKIYQNKIIDNYKQNLAEQGINPDAPAVEKLIIDGFNKLKDTYNHLDKIIPENKNL